MTLQEVSDRYSISLDKVEAGVAMAQEKWGMSEDQAIQLICCANDRYGYAFPSLIRVRDKSNELVSFVPTKLHKKFKKHQKPTSFCVKPRQVWFTTMMIMDYYLDCIDGKGVKALFVNLDNRTTEEVFDRVKTANDEFTLKSLLPKEQRNTTRKIQWDNGASYDAITCKNDDGPDTAKTLGRSCTVQRIHVTEAAYMRYYREFVGGLLDSRPKSGTVVFESTGNGADGGFYEDCMEIYEKGKLVAPNVWHLGDKSLHFFGWWEHPEYRLSYDPLEGISLTASQRHKLEQSEAEHLEEMRKDSDLSEAEISECINWRRWKLLTDKGFLRDPEGAVLECDREYPAKLRHAFSTSGSSFLSMTLTDRRKEEWKAINAETRLPVTGRVMKAGDGKYTVFPGYSDVMFWSLPYDSDKENWTDRYCLGADVGGGNADSDPDVIWVKDRLLNKYVAVAHGRFGPSKTADILMALGYMYHTARIAWETNNHGVAVSIKVWEAQYPNVYRKDDNAEDWKGLGFHTGERERDLALRALKVTYEDMNRPLQVPYSEFYKEASAFGPPAGKPSGKLQGQKGTHDDLIMAMAICEANSATMAAPSLVQEAVHYPSGSLGALREQLHGGGGGLRAIL